MKEKQKKDILILLLLGTLCIIGVFIGGQILGSHVDWLNQHVMFPDYFRNEFYKTGNLFPQIAWNLGLGQNIYNFAYYGFLNPIVLLSYFFPFVEMTNYIMISCSLLYLLSIYLFYKWIEPKYERKTSFLLSLIFLFSGPLLFHFHRQIMFVNYFPFLILSFIIIDKNKKYWPVFLIITIFLTIMSSYYYSVGAIVTILFYYFYKHYYETWKNKLKVFIPVIIAILLSGILIIPTLSTIFSGRSGIGKSINLLSLLLPSLDFDQVLYGSYALGLTAITVPSLISSILHKNREKRFLGISLFILIVFPVFRYFLNGGLYVRSKALIPFLPLFILVIGNFLDDIFHKKIDYSKIVKVTLMVTVLGLFTGYYHFAYYVDLLLSLLLIYFCNVKNHQKVFYAMLSILSFFLFVGFQFTEDFVTYNEYLELHKYDNMINEQLEKDTSFYRFANTVDTIGTVNSVYHPRYYTSTIYSSTYNANYYNFYHNILNSNNATYNHLMLVDTNNIIMHRLFGVKYILSEYKMDWGYSLLNQKNGYYLYKNDYSLSLGYATNKLYTKDSVANYNYPYNLEALLTGIIVENADIYVPSYTKPLENNYSLFFEDNISISNDENFTILEVTEDSTIKVKFTEPIIDNFLFIEFIGLEENSCDTELSIEINNIENRLTCKEWNYPNKNNSFHFLINEESIDTLNLNISQGTYKITNINLYTMSKDVLREQFDLMYNIVVNNNKISGNIDVTNAGYMMLSIPYDEGFTIILDGNTIEYEFVNDGFIGFKIADGQHKIEIIYTNPKFKFGVMTSLLGLLIAIILFLILKFKNLKKFVDN